MKELILYMAPGSCAKVTMIALNELGLNYQTQLVRFMKGEHRSTDYLAKNPLGKVPMLMIDGQVLTENVAILTYLHTTFGGLLPKTNEPLQQAQQLADLCFCSSTLHPNVTRIRLPQFFVDEKSNAASVKRKAFEAMTPHFQLIEKRLANADWWYGDEFSAVDAYIYWVFWRVAGADFDVSSFPAFQAHAARIEARDSVKKAIKTEDEATAMLASEGLLFTPEPVKI